MFFEDSYALVSEQERKQETITLAQKLIVGISIAAAISVAAGILYFGKKENKMQKNLKENVSNTVKIMKNTVEQGAAAVKDSVAKTEHDVHTAIKNDCAKTEDAKKDIQHGFHKVERVINKTANKISKDLK